jgi:hypothetical protein
MQVRLLEFSPHPVGPQEASRVPISNMMLWFGALGPPIAWAIHLMTMYPLVEVACRLQSTLPLYGMSAVLVLMNAAAGLVSWYYLRFMRTRNGATVPRRVRFMARAGLAASALFMIVIVAQTLPVFFDDPCQLQGRRAPSVLPHL